MIFDLHDLGIYQVPREKTKQRKAELTHALLFNMKERGKNFKVRTYDAEGYMKRAGCLCFRTDKELEVLLVTSNRFPDQWIVPSGGVEHGESFQDAAVREVLEEAGVCGSVQRPVGLFQNDANRSRTMLYTLTVKQEFDVWQDAGTGRKRGWFPMDRALAVLSHRPCQQTYLFRAMNIQLTQKTNLFRLSCQHCSLSRSSLGKKQIQTIVSPV